MKPDLRLEFEADKVYFLKHASCLPAKICNTSQSKNVLQAFSSNIVRNFLLKIIQPFYPPKSSNS